MKKAKLFTTVFSVALAGALCVGLTACGDNPFSSKAWKMKSEEVTAEQWTEAFKEDNFKNVKIESTTIQEGKFENKDGTKEDAKVVIERTAVIVDDVQYYTAKATVKKGSQNFKDYVQNLNAESYSTKTGEGKYNVVYKNKDGKWRQYPAESGVAKSVLYQYLGLGNFSNVFKYVDAESGYMLDASNTEVTGDELQYLNGYRLKFKDGKLAAVFGDHTQTETTTVDDGDGSISSSTQEVGRTYESVTFTYGGQKTKQVPTPQDSAYEGTWQTYQITNGEKTYNLGDAVAEMDDMTLTADFVKVEAKGDGTATVKSPSGTDDGIYYETYKGIYFDSNVMWGDLEYDGTYLKIELDNALILVLAKA